MTNPVLDDLFDRLNDAATAKDVDATMALFHAAPDTVFVGSAPTEVSIGADAIRGFFTAVYRAPITVGWRLRDSAVTQDDRFMWFYREGVLEVRQVNGTATALPYRVSGVIERRDGAWRWSMFHGSRPA